ncbi:MAG: PEP-CTERM sorting domain-containing protein [Vicinamibacterales bacterium]
MPGSIFVRLARWVGTVGAVACALSAQVLPAAAAPIEVKTDFVFIIDATSSMAGEIAGVRNGFAGFVAGLNADPNVVVDARFAVVVFGGLPELILDFTSDTTLVQARLNAVTIGANPGIQNNHNVNPEAGLEAIRMVLGAAPDSELANNNIPEDGFLNFRNDARKNLILATDEDSDLPFQAVNRQAGQTTTDPPGVLTPAWQAEVDATAQAAIRSGAFLNMLVNRGDTPSASQYGDYLKDVSDPDLLNFDEVATLAALQADPATANSLQAQVLAAGLIARTFNITGANDPDFVNNFFAAKVQEVTTDPGPDPVPEPGTFGLLGAGVLAWFVTVRRRRA